MKIKFCHEAILSLFFFPIKSHMILLLQFTGLLNLLMGGKYIKLILLFTDPLCIMMFLYPKPLIRVHCSRPLLCSGVCGK